MTDKRFQAYNRHSGAMIRSAADWIPGNALIQPASWYLTEEGNPSFEWDGYTDMCWDGCETETLDGYTVYWDENGQMGDERGIVLVEVDDAYEPPRFKSAEELRDANPIPVTPRRHPANGRRFHDAGVRDSTRDLLNAAWSVIHNWSSGDLAGAVNNLEGSAVQLADALGLERPTEAEMNEDDPESEKD